MSTELLIALIAGSALTTAGLFFSGWWARGKVAGAKLSELRASLRLLEARLATVRGVLASELQKAHERAEGAREDMQREKLVGEALADPDPVRRLQRVLLLFSPERPAEAPPGEQGGSA